MFDQTLESAVDHLVASFNVLFVTPFWSYAFGRNFLKHDTSGGKTLKLLFISLYGNSASKPGLLFCMYEGWDTIPAFIGDDQRL